MELTPVEICVVQDALNLLIKECTTKFNYTDNKLFVMQKELAQKILSKLNPIIG